MNKKIILIVIAAILLVAGGYGIYHFAFKKTAGKEDTKKAELYICPMHPQIHSDHPGTCSICGMDLVLNGKTNAYNSVFPYYENIGPKITLGNCAPILIIVPKNEFTH